MEPDAPEPSPSPAPAPTGAPPGEPDPIPSPGASPSPEPSASPTPSPEPTPTQQTQCGHSASEPCFVTHDGPAGDVIALALVMIVFLLAALLASQLGRR